MPTKLARNMRASLVCGKRPATVSAAAALRVVTPDRPLLVGEFTASPAPPFSLAECLPVGILPSMIAGSPP